MTHGSRKARKEHLKLKERQLDNRRPDRTTERSNAIVLAQQQLIIRPLELIDSRRIIDLIYKVAYLGISKTIAIETIQKWDFLVVNVVTSILVYWLSQSMWIANIWFFIWPFVGYMYITSSMGSNEYNKGLDTHPGAEFFNYWSESDRYMLIAEHNGKIVGCICMMNKSPIHAVVIRVVADLDAMKYDVTEDLFRTLMEHCQERGIESLDFITTYAEKHISRPKLYKKLGFMLGRTFQKGALPFFKVPLYEYNYIFEPEDVEIETETRMIKKY